MSPSAAPAADETNLPAPTAAQSRIIDAALELFAEHGVGGTSLQMIADRIGVTKAAVYHQYKTKDEIVLAVGESELAKLQAVVAAAEAEPTRKWARDVLVAGMVELAVERGPKVRAMLNDPVISRLFADHETYRDTLRRSRRVLFGDDAGTEARTRTAMLVAAINGAATHPFVAELDEDVLRAELLRLARRFLGLPG